MVDDVIVARQTRTLLRHFLGPLHNLLVPDQVSRHIQRKTVVQGLREFHGRFSYSERITFHLTDNSSACCKLLRFSVWCPVVYLCVEGDMTPGRQW